MSEPDALTSPGRARGWRRTLVLKDLLCDESDDATVRRVAEAVSARLTRFAAEYPDDEDLAAIVEEFNDIARDGRREAAQYNDRWTPCRHFNDVMDSLYDWADDERVWIS